MRLCAWKLYKFSNYRFLVKELQDALYWFIFRSGTYEIAEAEGVNRGTKITVHLKDNDKRFALKNVVEGS